jgi:hypothetical protein
MYDGMPQRATTVEGAIIVDDTHCNALHLFLPMSHRYETQDVVTA